MNIQELRKTKERLTRTMNRLPAENAPESVWARIEGQAVKAGAEYHELRGAFALLDEVDKLAAHLDKLEAAIACGGCGQNVAWTCPNCGFGNEGAPEVYIIEEEQA